MPRLTAISTPDGMGATNVTDDNGNGAFDLSTDDITYTIRADFDQPVYIGGRDLSYDQQGFEFISATSISESGGNTGSGAITSSAITNLNLIDSSGASIARTYRWFWLVLMA